LLVLTACVPLEVEHTLRETPTEEEQAEIIQRLKYSTVALQGYFMEIQVGLGSGLIFKREDSPNGKYYYYVVTNHHVLRGATSMQVYTEYGTIEAGDIYVTSETKETASFEDIGIVRFESEFEYPIVSIIPYLDPLTVVRVSVGQTVFGIGSPSTKDNLNLMTN